VSGPVAVTGGQTTTYDVSLEPQAVGAVSVDSITADPQRFVEGSVTTITLAASISGAVEHYGWTQVSGPRTTLADSGTTSTTVDVSALSVATDVELTFELTVTDATGATASGTVSVFVRPIDMEPILGENIQMGGSSTAVETFAHHDDTWTLFNIGSRLVATPFGMEKGASYSVYAPAGIHDIEVVSVDDTRYALLSCGIAGIVVADITDPTDIMLRLPVRVDFYRDGITFAESGGAILYDNIIESLAAHVAAHRAPRGCRRL